MTCKMRDGYYEDIKYPLITMYMYKLSDWLKYKQLKYNSNIQCLWQ